MENGNLSFFGVGNSWISFSFRKYEKKLRTGKEDNVHRNLYHDATGDGTKK